MRTLLYFYQQRVSRLTNQNGRIQISLPSNDTFRYWGISMSKMLIFNYLVAMCCLYNLKQAYFKNTFTRLFDWFITIKKKIHSLKFTFFTATHQTCVTCYVIGLLKQTFIHDCMTQSILQSLNKLDKSLFSFPFELSVPFWNVFIGLLKEKTSLLNISDHFFGLCALSKIFCKS